MGSLKDFDSIKTHNEFNAIYKKGTKLNTKTVIVYYLDGNIKNVGFTATKKIGIAVIRNKAKRLLRAVFIRNIDKLQIGSFVFVAKHNLVECGFHQVNKDIYWALNKLNILNKKKV